VNIWISSLPNPELDMAETVGDDLKNQSILAKEIGIKKTDKKWK
jgi:hypothetical protein